MNSPPRISAKIMSNSTDGYELWDIQAIQPLLDHRRPTEPEWLQGLDTVYEVRDIDDVTKSDAFCGLEPDQRTGISRERCTCYWHSQSGKRCRHLWAMLFYMRLGSAVEHENNMANYLSVMNKLRIQDLEDGDDDDDDDDEDNDNSQDNAAKQSREQQIADYFRINKDSLADWSFVEQLAADRTSRTVYEDVRPGGRPPKMIPIRHDKRPNAPNPDFLKPNDSRGMIKPAGTANPGAACWLIALTAALCHVGDIAEMLRDAGEIATPQQLQAVKWLRPIVRHFERLRQGSVSPLIIIELYRAICDSTTATEDRQEDPCQILNELLHQLDSADFAAVIHAFTSSIRTKPVCEGCRSIQGSGLEHRRQIMVVIEPDDSTLPIDRSLRSNERQSWVCRSCSYSNTTASAHITTEQAPNVLWVECQYSCVAQAIESNQPPPEVWSPDDFRVPDQVLLPASTVGGDPLQYDLRAVTLRRGASAETGHNLSVVRKGDVFWKMDDRAVMKVANVNAVLEADRRLYPTAIFYVLTSSPSSQTTGRTGQSTTNVRSQFTSGKTSQNATAAQSSTEKTDLSWSYLPPHQRWDKVPSEPKLSNHDPFYKALDARPAALAEPLWRDTKDPVHLTGLRLMISDFVLAESDLDFQLEIPIGGPWLSDELSVSAKTQLKGYIDHLRPSLDRGSEPAHRMIQDAFVKMVEKPATWYGESQLDEFLARVEALSGRRPPDHPYGTTYRRLNYDVQTIMKGSCDVVPNSMRRKNKHNLPLARTLGLDRGWRDRITVLPSIVGASHFGAMVIHGPRRSIFFHDSLDCCSNGRFEQVYAAALRYRMLLEERARLCDSGENTGWAFYPNSPVRG